MPQYVALPPLEITRLRVSGFKSFSDPVELQLDPGLTGIVGPNGCGKSNIVEALRWAMGEGSAKGLRSDGMEDVIFNGSATRPAHDVAEVRLKLHGRPEGLAGFEEAGELEVARRIGRGTGSVYRLNGREVRARDIQLLFADAGAGSRSPAIIGQGQIGFIVDSRPVERRRLLEEAAGIGGLQGRRREAELRLEATRANLQRVLDLLGSQEARLAELTKQSRQAQRYRQLAADLRVTESHCLLARYSAAAHQAAAGNEAVAAASAAHERQLAEVAQRRRARDDLAAILPGRREAAATGQARLSELRERLAGLREASSREAAHLAALGRQRDEAAADLERAGNAVEELAATVAALAAEATEVGCGRDAMVPLSAQAGAADAAAAAELAAAQARLREAVGHGAEAAARDEAARAHVTALQSRLTSVRCGLDELPAVDAARARLAEAEVGADTARTAVEEARTAVADAEAELGRLIPTREARRAELLSAEQMAGEHKERLAAEESRLREVRAAAARLAERRAAFDRGLIRLAERRSAHDSRAEMLAGQSGEADVAARESELAAAESALAAADTVLDGAREALSAAEHARADAAAAVRDQRRTADALEAEIRVLESLAPPEIDGGLLDRIEVPGELMAALAAALGDDLLAGTDKGAPRHWLEPPPMPRAPLPAGAISLLELVQAPAVLTARLAQIGLIEVEDAAVAQASLVPGQRLVSRDGGLWRWDGFVRCPGAEDAATARVRHQLRLHAAREEHARLLQTLAAHETRLGEAERWLQASRVELGEAETAWRAADGAQLRTRQRVADAVANARRLQDEIQRLGQDAEALARDAAELEAERRAIEASAESAAEEAEQVALAEAAREVVAATLQELERKRALLAELDAAHAAALRRRQSAGAGLERASAALEAARATKDGLARRLGELEAERRTREAALGAELAELEAGLAEAEHAASAASRAADERRLERATAEEHAARAEADRQRAGEELARLAAEVAALERRGELLHRSHEDAERRLRDEHERSAGLGQRAQRLAAELQQARASSRADPTAMAALAGELETVEAAVGAGRIELERQETAATDVARELEAAEAALAALGERLAVAQAERAHAHEALAASVAAVRERLQQDPISLLDDEATRTAVASAGVEELEARLGKLRAARDRLGPVNLRADTEAQELEVAVTETKMREAELQQATERLRAGIATLDREARERLMVAFEAVDGHFRRLFATLFGGGKAHLRLIEADDPLRAGLELEASPPGKKLASISQLSGGEKTLTALALVFAFFLAQPSPLCVLDEVDAPLDDANVDRFVALMQEIAQATATRFLVVTHHPLTMARMDRLYGVTMAERGISRLVSVALERALELRATA